MSVPASNGQTQFLLNKKQWDQFLQALDAPPRIIPAVKKLFTKPSIAESR